MAVTLLKVINRPVEQPLARHNVAHVGAKSRLIIAHQPSRATAKLASPVRDVKHHAVRVHATPAHGCVCLRGLFAPTGVAPDWRSKLPQWAGDRGKGQVPMFAGRRGIPR
eukprot:4136216-Pleurochrysis_carterae.AAC.1